MKKASHFNKNNSAVFKNSAKYFKNKKTSFLLIDVAL